MVTIFFAFYTLFLSSINKNRRYVAILIFGLYVFTEIIYEILKDIFRSDYFSLLSVRANIQQVGYALFRQNLPHDVPWVLALAVIVGFCVLGGFVLKSKIRGVEIVK